MGSAGEENEQGDSQGRTGSRGALVGQSVTRDSGMTAVDTRSCVHSKGEGSGERASDDLTGQLGNELRESVLQRK